MEEKNVCSPILFYIALKLKGKFLILSKLFKMLFLVIDFFKTNDIHYVKLFFNVDLCLLVKFQMFQNFWSMILNDLITLMSKGWSSWKIWANKVNKSKPIVIAY
jgi:hypothetical protein